MFEGKVRAYEDRTWDGYVVIQAKYRETLSGSDSDPAWLIKQLGSEVKKFKSKKSSLRKPDYYIVATNVSLSGSDGPGTGGKTRVGGYTKVANTLKQWQKSGGPADFDIWPSAKIVDLLIGFPEIRRTYAAWVTSGDVLTAMLDSFSPTNKQFGMIVNRGLKEALRRDQHARLNDAGSVDDDRVRVSQVFIDLPVARDSEADRFNSNSSKRSEPRKEMLVSLLVDRAREKFGIFPEDTLASGETEKVVNNRIVILGGPGQGKSTASLFLAQLFRAALLRDNPTTGKDSNVNRLVPEIIDRARSEGIQTELVRRYPVWISLPRFADAISIAKSKNELVPSLLTFLAMQMAAASDHDVTRGDLRNWLKVYPWIVILDGLDEVPHSGERDAVIDAIDSFQTEIVEDNSDTLTIVTTRPQGYNNDLDKRLWEHWNLLELDSERALAYARGLGETRYPLDSARREEVLELIEKASTRSTTSRLLISPLQVTIMYLIVDTGSNIPAARWNLFNEYFDVLRKRERAKPGASKKVLEQNWSHLGPIHQRAGLVLQTDSEGVGSALSFFETARFRSMLRGYLTGEGFTTTDIDERVKQLLALSLQRLVLLCSREEEKIAFDVRSLQEFMAASALTSGADSDVENRLGHIAGLSHWRHVFLIAASRCFAEDKMHHMRSRIVALPRTLDCEAGGLEARMGSLLSLEMFVDGIGFDHPTSRKLLARHALELLSCGIDDFDDRLASLFDEHTENIVLDTLRCEICKPYRGRAFFPAWKMLLILSKKRPEVFLKVAEEQYPPDSAFSNKILNHLSNELPSETLVNKCVAAILSGPPSEFSADHYFDRLDSWSSDPDYVPQDKLVALNFELPRNDFLSFSILPDNKRSAANIMLVPYNGVGGVFFKSVGGGWHELSEVDKFCRDPRISTLATFVLNVVTRNFVGELMKLRWNLPWPLVAVVIACDATKDAAKIINDVNSGLYGNQSSWREAENRWRENGISESDLINFGLGLPSSPTDNPMVPLFHRYSVSHMGEDAARLLRSIGFLIDGFPDAVPRKEFLRFYQFIALGIDRAASVVELPLARKLLSLIARTKDVGSLYFMSVCDSEIWTDSDSLDNINQIADYLVCYNDRSIHIDLPHLISAFNLNIARRGLLQIIAIVWSNNNLASDVLIELDASAFTTASADSALTAEAVFILNEAGERIYDINDALLVFSANIKQSNTRLLSVYSRIDNFWGDDRARVYGTLLSEIGEGHSDYYHDLLGYLRKAIGSARSTLSFQSTWLNDLHLPADAFGGLLPKQTVQKLM